MDIWLDALRFGAPQAPNITVTLRYEKECKMREDSAVARFTPPTPRSRRLGRELRKLREARAMNMEAAAGLLHCSTSRISRIESGEIKPRTGDVMELLVAYDIALDSDEGRALLA